MSNIKNIFLILLCAIFLSACGGGGDSSDAETSSVSTKNALADPDASFDTYQSVTFTAFNNDDNNITLFIDDNSGNLLARQYIETEGSAEITIQLPAADQEVQASWHYLENVKDEMLQIADLDLSSISFDGVFDDAIDEVVEEE